MKNALRSARPPACCSPAARHRHRVVIGKDTRLSGYMIEPALTAGFIGAGHGRALLGPLPTPAVAMLTRSLRADLGVMISASHNPYEDNGIKLFGPDGFKLSDETERRDRGADGQPTLQDRLAAPAKLGRAAGWMTRRRPLYRGGKASFPRGLRSTA
jgi:phosphoglucosamine mutase